MKNARIDDMTLLTAVYLSRLRYRLSISILRLSLDYIMYEYFCSSEELSPMSAIAYNYGVT